MRTILGLMVALGVVGVLAGCGPKVNCDKLDKRLSECTKDLMFKLQPDALKRLNKATDPEVKKANEAQLARDVERNRATLKKQVVEQCKTHKGRAADAKLITTCLEKKSCGDFAACFGVYLKEKSK